CSDMGMRSRSFHLLREDEVYSAIVDAPIEPARLLARVAARGNGATVLFLGTVRDINEGRAVIGIEYTAYRSLAERELCSSIEEARTSRSIRSEHRVSPDIGDGPLQLSLFVLHAGGRSHVAPEARHPELRGDCARCQAARAARVASTAHNGRRADDSSADRAS